MNRKAAVKGSFVLRSIEELVPDNHLVRKLEKAIDWDFIYEEVEGLYSNIGRKSIDPVVLFKMIMINYQFGYNSMRKTCREIEVNVAYRWFLGISFEEKVPDYSTWSQNYIRRYGESEVFEKIFNRIIEEGIKKHYIKPETVFGDSTHQKACANKRKTENKEVEIPNLRDKTIRDEYRNDTMCTDPKVAGDMLIPSFSKGNLDIPKEVYENQKKKLAEGLENDDYFNAATTQGKIKKEEDKKYNDILKG